MGSSIIALSAVVTAMILEQRLRAHRKHVVLAVLALSIAVRAVYYAELSLGPCLWTHPWTESDNAFFDRWAKDIAGGDWLTDQSLHPMVSWNYEMAKMYFARHPEWAAAGDEAARATALWDRWYGGKTFHQEPLYAYSIALTYRLFGEDVRWVFLWQMALGVLTNLMLWDLARRYFGETAGALTGLMVVVFAPLYYLELTLVRTTLLTFLAVAMLFQAERAAGKEIRRDVDANRHRLRHRNARPVDVGCLRGRMSGGAHKELSPAVADRAPLFAGDRGRDADRDLSGDRAQSGGGRAGVFSLASNGALTFIGSFDASATPEMGGGGFNFRRIEQVMDESGARSWPAIRMAVASHGSPWTFGWLLARKFAKYWQWYEEPDNQNFYYFRLYSRMLSWSLTLWLLAPLMLAGLVLAAPRFERCALLYALAATGITMGVIAQPVARYRAGYLAATLPFAAFALVEAATWWRERRCGRFGLLAAVVGAAFLWTSRPLPAGRPEIRTADFLAPYYFYWIPQHPASVKDGRWHEAAALLQGSLRHQPEDAAQRREPAQAYLQVHTQIAPHLLQSGDAAGAARETQRAHELEVPK